MCFFGDSKAVFFYVFFLGGDSKAVFFLEKDGCSYVLLVAVVMFCFKIIGY